MYWLLIQNAAARFVTGVWKYEQSSAWRRFYTVYTGSQSDSESLLRQQSSSSSVSRLHGQAPPYLIELCRPTSMDVRHRPIRSACTHRLVVPRTKTSYGDSGPSVWNSLPNDLRSTDMSIETFRARLKAFLFGHWLQPICCFLRIWAIQNNGIIIIIILFGSALYNVNERRAFAWKQFVCLMQMTKQ